MDRHFLITVSDQKSAAYGVRFVADFFSDKKEIKATLFYSVPKAADIILEGENSFYDAAVIGRRGLSLLQAAFEDSTSQALFKEKFTIPLWLCRSSNPSRKNVLLFIDGSAASLRMADHIGFILGQEKQHKVDILATESILSQSSVMEQYESALNSNGVTQERIKTRSCGSGNPGKIILKIMEKEAYAAVALGRSSNEPNLMVRLFRGPVCSILFNDLKNAALWLCP